MAQKKRLHTDVRKVIYGFVPLDMKSRGEADGQTAQTRQRAAERNARR